MTDPVIVKAVSDAQSVLRDYIQPGPRDAADTLNRLIAILDAEQLVRAMRNERQPSP